MRNAIGKVVHDGRGLWMKLKPLRLDSAELTGLAEVRFPQVSLHREHFQFAIFCRVALQVP